MEDIISKYNKTATEYAASRIGTEDLLELEKFKGMINAGDAVLDVGCAAGRDTRILKDMGLNVTGCDMADKLLAIARTENPDINFVHADMRDLPFKELSFKAIWASAVLHHVDKTQMADVLHEFRRVLKKDGLLYIHTKTGSGKLRTHEASVSGEERAFELITAEELNKMLVDNGYLKLSLEVVPSKSREGLFWVNAFYKKV